ncbi:unnamed protein product [Calypogeia fissa]
MEYLVDPNITVKREDGCHHPQQFEIDPHLLLRKDHFAWLFHILRSIPQSNSDSVHFCVSCNRYLMPEEDPTLHKHQFPQGPHHLFPLIRVQTGTGMGGNYYVSVQVLRDIQVPIGDVLSHMLPHPPRHGVNGVGHKVRCMYLHPPASSQAKWQGAMLSGKCAYKDCERVFPNRHSHLRLYGVTPQFCSISCKLKTWVRCNK